jgi:hypothetical protein
METKNMKEKEERRVPLSTIYSTQGHRLRNTVLYDTKF